MLDSTTFVTLGQWLSTLPVTSWLGIPPAVLMLVWWRTRSAHVLWFRLWSLFIGRRAAADSPVERFHDAQMEMLKFRFLTNIAVRTPRHVVPAIAWLERYDQPPAAVAACGAYFDASRPGLTDAALRLGVRHVAVSILVWGALVLAATPFGFGALQDRALLKFGSSGHWFTLDEQRAKRLNDSPGFALADCRRAAADIARTADFRPDEVKAICDAANSGEIALTVREGVEAQRPWFALIACTLLAAALPFVRTTNQMEAAIQLRKVVRQYAAAAASEPAADMTPQPAIS